MTPSLSSLAGSIAEPSWPDAHAWSRALGWPETLPRPQLIARAVEHLEHQRWKNIGEAWPKPDQAVDVLVMTQGTGERFVAEARFQETANDLPDLLWPWEHDENGHPIPDASLAELNLDILKRRAYGASFSMSGGDWSASFPGPLFSRRGMDYMERETAPLLIITHWRTAAQVPQHLNPPSHLQALLQSVPTQPL